jgi:hypothetical protein
MSVESFSFTLYSPENKFHVSPRASNELDAVEGVAVRGLLLDSSMAVRLALLLKISIYENTFCGYYHCDRTARGSSRYPHQQKP